MPKIMSVIPWNTLPRDKLKQLGLCWVIVDKEGESHLLLNLWYLRLKSGVSLTVRTVEYKIKYLLLAKAINFYQPRV